MKLFNHLKLICKHKWFVFINCCKLGIPIKGIFHDFSKFSYIELFNSVKYYTGVISPIDKEKSEKGYSLAWLHHRGRNPHHWEYWIDNLYRGGEALRIPYKYVLEMICDWIAAGKIYDGKSWNKESPFKWFNKKYNAGRIKLHLDTYTFIFNVLYEYSKTGDIKNSVNKFKTEYNNYG